MDFRLVVLLPISVSIASARGCASRVYGIIARESPIDAVDETKGIKVTDIEGRIDFQNIFFSYPTRPDVPILRGFDLSIKSGEKVALVGSSGCGKSTTVNLVERFYDPDAGTVLIDGVDIKEYNIRSLRQKIGMVTQEPVLFSTTVYQNIVWGAVDPENNPPTKDQVIEAARAANAHAFISRLPDGYDTVVGEGGALLSGGQKQRIAIARALVRNPKILLLDEATSALDTESERLVQNALDKLSRSRTSITIAHRLSTIRSADRICVIREGQVVETGTHQSLIELGGEYATMVHAQRLRQAARAKIDDAETKDGDEVNIDRLVAEEANRTKSIARRTSTHQLAKSSIGGETNSGKLVVSKPDVNQESNLRHLFSIYWRNRRQLRLFIPATISAIVQGSIFPLFSIVLSKLMVIFTLQDRDEFKRQNHLYALYFLIFAGGDFISMFARTYFFTIGSEKLTRRIQYLSFKAMLRQDARFFDDEKNGTGALTAKLATEAEDVNKVGSLVISAFVAAIASLFTGISVAFASDWRMTLIIFGVFATPRHFCTIRAGNGC